MADNGKDLLNPENTPSSVKEGKQLSSLAPILICTILGLIGVCIVVAIMRRGPSVSHRAEDVKIVTVKKVPIGEDGVGEIEPAGTKVEPNTLRDGAEHTTDYSELAKLRDELEMVSASKEQVELQKNIYWEKYKEAQLQSGEARQQRLMAAVKSTSTVSGASADQKNGAAEESDPYASLKSSLNGVASPAGNPAANYDGSDYTAMTQQMIQNQLAMVNGDGSSGSVDNQNMQASKNAFFNKSFSEGNYNDHQFKKVKAKSKYTLHEGSIIDGLMISGINSDLPGLIVAKVSKDIYDSIDGKHLVIPQGTELVGRYSSAVAYAQDRVAFGWTRMIFKNGDSINLGNMGGVDQQGYSGIKDQVDNHYFRLFGQIALVSFFQAIPALINPTESESKQKVETVTSTHQEVVTDANGNQTIVTLTDTNPVTTTSSSSSGGTDEFQSEFKESYGQTMAEVGVALAKRNMSIQPTLKVRPGHKFKIIVTKDMILPPSSIEGKTI